jgi:hypothetical protein
LFSSRLEWNAPTNPLSTLLAEKRARGAPLLDLTESNPTRAGLDYPGDLLTALTDPAALRYDPDPRGLLSAREAVSDYYAQRGVEVPASRILLTASTSEAYSYLFKLLTDPGDEILVPRPSYPLFDYLAAMESVTVGQYPLRYDGVWHIDFPALAAAITPRTRAIVVVNPNNPTGSYLKHAEWEHLQTFNLPILSDEVFSDFAFSPDPTRITTLAGQSSVPTFSMSGLSKIAGLPQMKLGWIAASGPHHAAALDALEWIADTYLSVSTPVQLALPRLLASTVQGQIRAQTRSNLDYLNHHTSASPCRALTPEGGWYAILEVPRILTEEAWVLQLLAEKDVLVQPGFFYDFESEAFLVLSLLTPPAIFAEGLRRILESTASLA